MWGLIQESRGVSEAGLGLTVGDDGASDATSATANGAMSFVREAVSKDHKDAAAEDPAVAVVVAATAVAIADACMETARSPQRRAPTIKGMMSWLHVVCKAVGICGWFRYKFRCRCECETLEEVSVTYC
jgi:hypothetical protein